MSHLSRLHGTKTRTHQVPEGELINIFLIGLIADRTVCNLCMCLSQVCEVQTSQSDVRDGQHAAKGAAGKVSAESSPVRTLLL